MMGVASGPGVKKIALILPDLRGGGAERLHIHLANDWVARGHAVDFVLMQRRGELLALAAPGINIIDLGVRRIREVVSPLRNYLRRSRPDHVLAALWPLTSAAVVAWRLSGRCGDLFLSDHNQLSISCIREMGVPRLLLRTVMALTYPQARGVIAVSQGVKDDLCRLGGLSPAKVRVIYNPTATGVPAHREPAGVRSALWGPGFRHHILSVGTLKAQKDHATLLRAFAALPASLGAKLVILGEGGLRGRLEALVAELGLGGRVALPGFVADPYPWFRSADLFVLSSQWEGFGNVLVEALECGVPVVSTDCQSGPAEILEHGRHGRLVPTSDPRALARAMEVSLAQAPDRAALMARAQDFSVAKISQQYLDYFDAAAHPR